MANTVFGPYAKTVWTNGSTPANQTNMSNLETQASVALNGFNGDLLTAFVLSGITCTKDGTVANQLDIAAGRAYITMSDGTRGLIVVAADNTHTTSGASVTWYLALQPDGTWYWNTVNSPATHSLSIATVVTDASGNIATVTDTRVTTATLLAGMGALVLPNNADLFYAGLFASFNAMVAGPASGVQAGGTNVGHLFQTWNGSAVENTFAVGATVASGNGLTQMATTGAFQQVASQPTAGSFGVPPIVAQALSTHVTTTATAIVLTFTPPADGLYRASLYAYLGNATSPATITADVNWIDPNDLAHTQTAYFTVQNASTGGVNPVTLKGASVATAAGANNIACFPICISVKSGQPQGIDLRWTDATGTPNDFVTAMIERLA